LWERPSAAKGVGTEPGAVIRGQARSQCAREGARTVR
jgi:hypothetical protein